REVDMRRAPCVVMIAPGIFAGANRDEAVAALRVGRRASGAGEVRVERRIVLVGAMWVAPGSVGLPDLDQRMRNGLAVLVEHASVDDDALADRLAFVLASQIVISRLDIVMAENRTGQFRERLGRNDERLRRMAFRGRRVRRIVIVGLSPGMRAPIGAGLLHRSGPFIRGAPVMRCNSSSSRPSTISMTVSPRSVTSMTARSV